MQRVITLPLSTSKCSDNVKRCERADFCARKAVAYVPGRPVEDFTVAPAWTAAGCIGFISLDDAKAAPVAPRVHPPISG